MHGKVTSKATQAKVDRQYQRGARSFYATGRKLEELLRQKILARTRGGNAELLRAFRMFDHDQSGT